MKIAIIAHSLYPIKEPFAGGLEQITYTLCKHLHDKGHTVHLYAHKNSDSFFDIKSFSSNRNYPKHINKDLEDEPNNFGIDNVTLAYMNAMKMIAREKYDIVHNHSLHHIPIIWGQLLNLPMVTSIHTPPFTLLQIGAFTLQPTSMQIFTMVSNNLRNTWKSIVPEALVVRNGIDLDRWPFIENPKGDYLFWYGRICPEKGTVEAIEMASRANRRILLAGPIANQQYFAEEVEPLLAKSNVEYKGHLNQSDIPELLGNARLLLFTSKWEEPYGLTMAESLACGTPVFAFNSGATHEILTRCTGIIVDKLKPETWNEGLENALHLSRKECRLRAENFCSSENMVDQYIALYEAMTQKGIGAIQYESC